MIKLISIILLFFSSGLSVYAQDGKLLASCCVAKVKEGRCTGSASCSACSNCSRCAHCSNGGSCGVCATYSKPIRYVVPRSAGPRTAKTATKSSVAYTLKSNSPAKPKKKIENKIFQSSDMLSVDSEILNLREGPGAEYEVIEILERYTLLKLIAIDGEWLQVKVIETGNFGYVNKMYVSKT